jgi:hypothetical protein
MDVPPGRTEMLGLNVMVSMSYTSATSLLLAVEAFA